MGLIVTRRALLGAVLLMAVGPARAQEQRFAELGDVKLEREEIEHS